MTTPTNWEDTGKLVSLDDMLRIYAHQYVNLGRNLESAKNIFQIIEANIAGGQKDDLDAKERQQLQACLERIRKTCEEVELNLSKAVIAKALKDPPQTSRELKLILEPVYLELKARLFLFVPPHRARYHESALDLKHLTTSFPKASNEIKHAGNCYADGEYTACVFHAMRATEISLWAFSRHLKITPKYPIESSEWQTLIQEVDKRVQGMINDPKTAARDEDMRFCSDTNSQFFNLKEAFRKYVAHARETYEEVPSLSILDRSMGFLQALSTKVKE